MVIHFAHVWAQLLQYRTRFAHAIFRSLVVLVQNIFFHIAKLSPSSSFTWAEFSFNFRGRGNQTICIFYNVFFYHFLYILQHWCNCYLSSTKVIDIQIYNFYTISVYNLQGLRLTTNLQIPENDCRFYSQYWVKSMMNF